MTKKIKVLKASGGEPFYDEQIIDLLKIYIKNNDAKNTILEFDTNGTLFTDELIDMLKCFKLLNHSISVDGVETVYEHIRYPHSFMNFKSSLKKYLSLDNIHCVHYAFVLSSINIFNINDFLFFIASITKNKDFYVNFEKVRPYDRGISINLLPIDILKDAKEEIMMSDFYKYYGLEKCRNLINSIDDGILNNEVNKEKFLSEIKLFDLARNQNFKNYLDKRIISWIHE